MILFEKNESPILESQGAYNLNKDVTIYLTNKRILVVVEEGFFSKRQKQIASIDLNLICNIQKVGLLQKKLIVTIEYNAGHGKIRSDAELSVKNIPEWEEALLKVIQEVREAA